MGQYYNAVVLKTNWKLAINPVKASVKCYDCDNNGAKIMEHCYVKNAYVRVMEFLLANAFKGHPFVWCGDYADKVETKTGTHDIYTDASHFIYKDYDDPRDYGKSKQYKALMATIPSREDIPVYRYIVNYTKKQYCIIPKYNEKKWQVHPLPLLTSSGNGRGGGDYRLDDDRVGSWAFDRIGVTNDRAEIKGFKQISGFFKLDW